MEMLRRTWHSEDLVEEKIRGTIIKKERVESETSDYIEEVARKLREDIERRKKLRQDALNTKPSQESQSDGGKRKRKRSPEPQEKGSLEAQEEAVQPPTEASPPPSPNPEEAGKAAAASDGLYHSSQIAMKKRKLTYLNRSILMKNLWKERREGTAQPRRQRLLIRREYQPRGSRTRNIKREDQAT
ncbi:hypothetical protein GWK47_004958 [Chionoecetes opilio]|uniref:Uncharacterized protein n=1 Tax=Chionoecetes opilio TaxID=41210 RepID=A0A8J4YCP1_CHIOP|nr:hypothetical protein GWK47_004958 [Chionoecetes opilio]